MLPNAFRFLSSVEAETPTGLYGWAKNLIETLQKWRLTDLIGQPLLENAGKFIRVKSDGGGYEHAAGVTSVVTDISYNETATNGDVVIFGSGPITVGLPTAVGNEATFNIKAVSGTVTISPDGVETIDGLPTDLSIMVGSSVVLRSDSANWWTF